MNPAHVFAITRREVREILSDWRVVTPMVILTLVLPQLLAAAANQVVEFVEDGQLAIRLIPFAALLVGFLPASFSLIAALESFVGERERNTLESLLSMPLSDHELYLGKLLSSLLTPLISSLLAMLFFTLLLIGLNPERYFGVMDASRLLLLILLVVGMALVMVTGAVVISSHITSVRAANLMSSFIMVPMAGVMQLAAVLIIDDRWPQLWLIAAALGLLAALLVRIGMRTFSREELLSRELRQGQLRLPWQRSQPQVARRSYPPEPLLGLSPALRISWRELVEVLSDWRVLVPLAIMTFGLPLALVAGTGFARDFVDNDQLLGSLVPFAGLLVGFVPASFALITAIESFVGERERNSLESLLSMPLADRQLYVGKMVAALLVPLFGSIIAILVFLHAIRLIYPQLYVVAMQREVLSLVLLMTSAITLLMVAGAVVISTHTSSIRAATLLASAVLVPTAVIIQLQALLFIATRYDVLWYVLAAVIVIAIAFTRSGLASFNREEILSREHDDLSVQGLWANAQRMFREYRPAGTPLNAYAGLPFSPRRFYRHELPALLYELRLPLLVATLACLLGLGYGFWIGPNLQFFGFAAGLNQALMNLGNPPEPSPGLALAIFLNNLRVALLSNLFSVFSFGLFAFAVPLVAFGQIGLIASRLAAQGGSWLSLDPASPLTFVLGYVVPHGIVELPTFVLSAALGLRIGAALLAAPPGFSLGQNLLWSLANFLKIWLLVLAPLIGLAAAIEGLITPLVIRALYG
ncbi:MAG: ABC transporter permease subunit [Oscillochloridaceae bacterium umkhey_bin13]